MRIFSDRAPEDVPERLELPPRYKKSFTAEEMEKFQTRYKAYQARKKREK